MGSAHRTAQIVALCMGHAVTILLLILVFFAITVTFPYVAPAGIDQTGDEFLEKGTGLASETEKKNESSDFTASCFIKVGKHLSQVAQLGSEAVEGPSFTDLPVTDRIDDDSARTMVLLVQQVLHKGFLLLWKLWGAVVRQDLSATVLHHPFLCGSMEEPAATAMGGTSSAIKTETEFSLASRSECRTASQGQRQGWPQRFGEPCTQASGTTLGATDTARASSQESRSPHSVNGWWPGEEASGCIDTAPCTEGHGASGSTSCIGDLIQCGIVQARGEATAWTRSDQSRCEKGACQDSKGQGRLRVRMGQIHIEKLRIQLTTQLKEREAYLTKLKDAEIAWQEKAVQASAAIAKTTEETSEALMDDDMEDANNTDASADPWFGWTPDEGERINRMSNQLLEALTAANTSLPKERDHSRSRRRANSAELEPTGEAPAKSQKTATATAAPAEQAVKPSAASAKPHPH